MQQQYLPFTLISQTNSKNNKYRQKIISSFIISFIIEVLSLLSHILSLYYFTTPYYTKTQQIIIDTIFSYLILCSLIAFLQTLLTNPGTTEKMLEYSDKVYMDNYYKFNDYKYIKHSKPQYCDICKIEKAERMHHDAFKNVCVARFDHRCSWTYCTIGLFNYPYFYKFCLYTGLFGLFGTINSIVAISMGKYAPNYENSIKYSIFSILLLWQFASLFSILIFIGHTRLTALNITTLENIEQVNSDIELKSYSKGSYKQNFKSILGSLWGLKLLLPFAIMIPSVEDNQWLVQRVTYDDTQ